MTVIQDNITITELEEKINYIWDNKDNVTDKVLENYSPYIDIALDKIDSGEIRVAEFKRDKEGNPAWIVNEWVKKAVLLSFKTRDNSMGYKDFPTAYDKVPLKFENWNELDFQQAKIRAVPGSIVRSGSYIGKDVVLMPSFVNIGAYVGDGTMVDSWATIGSCAQIGKNCHISGGAGIAGVLEPLQANPVIIEDNCFIGARSEIVEGVIVEEGAVIGMGVFIGKSTPIVNRETGEIIFGRVPRYSVVVAGSMPSKTQPDNEKYYNLPININCAVIVKQVDEKTRSKTGINDLLRMGSN